MALAATALLASSSLRAVGLEVSASTFVSNIGGYVANGDIHAAQAALRQLKTLGVRKIQVGKILYTVDQLIVLLDSPVRAQSVFAALVEALKTEDRAYFIASNRTITTVNWAQKTADEFPTGSAG